MGLAVFWTDKPHRLALCVFGWAKPRAGQSARYFRKIDRDMMLVGYSGRAFRQFPAGRHFLAFCSGRRSHFAPLSSGRTIPAYIFASLPAGRRNHQFRPGLAQFAAHSCRWTAVRSWPIFAAPICLALYGGGPLRLHNSPDIVSFTGILEQDSPGLSFPAPARAFCGCSASDFPDFPFMKFQGLENVRQTTHSIGHAANGPIASWPLFRASSGTGLNCRTARRPIFFVADWHALTSDYADTSKLRQNIRGMVLDWWRPA